MNKKLIGLSLLVALGAVAVAQTVYKYKCMDFNCQYIMQFEKWQGSHIKCSRCGNLMSQSM